MMSVCNVLLCPLWHFALHSILVDIKIDSLFSHYVSGGPCYPLCCHLVFKREFFFVPVNLYCPRSISCFVWYCAVGKDPNDLSLCQSPQLQEAFSGKTENHKHHKNCCWLCQHTSNFSGPGLPLNPLGSNSPGRRLPL